MRALANGLARNHQIVRIFGLNAIAQRFDVAASWRRRIELGVTDPDLKDRLVNIFAKAKTSPEGCIQYHAR
jgi:hypothetical protein